MSNTGGRAAPVGAIWKTIGSALLSALLVVVVVLAGAILVVPRVTGAVPLTVLTGSMRPAIQPGDLIVIRPTDPNLLEIGQIITFQPVSGDPTLVTHRIVNLTRNLQGETVNVLTRGDANNVDDASLIPDQVMGRMWYRVPRAGYITSLNAPVRLGVLAGIALLAYAVVNLIKPATSDTSEAKKSDANHHF